MIQVLDGFDAYARTPAEQDSIDRRELREDLVRMFGHNISTDAGLIHRLRELEKYIYEG